jgi:hypothetical protein
MDLPLNLLQKKKRPTDELHIGERKDLRRYLLAWWLITRLGQA